MTNSSDLFKLGKPCFYFMEIEQSPFANLYLKLVRENPGAITRMLRGKKCATLNSFYDEIGAALQFPYYFGENSGAFDECITDLDWIEGSAYLLMIDDSHLFLRDIPAYQFEGVIEALDNANQEWLTPNQYIPRNRLPTPFHVLFSSFGIDGSAFMQRLAQTNVEWAKLAVPTDLPYS